MYIVRENGGNILSYVGFSKLSRVIKYFPELNQKLGQEDMNFHISSSSIAIEHQNRNYIL